MVSGGTAGSDNLYQNWWWYRVNGTGASTRELGVRQATGTAVRTSSGPNQVSYAITTNATDSFVLSWTLTQINANTAVINYSCTVLNNATFARDISLFNYVDYFLANADAGDRLDTAYGPGVGVHGDRVMNISDSSNAGWGLSHWGYGADAYAVGTFSGVGGQITDTGIDNFADANLGAPVNPATGADITGVMQWNFVGVAAGGSATANGAIIVWNTVPTPGAAALLGLGGLAMSRRRRA
ncbi:MAG: MYXO-CTERM sorting domain-containing protein [Phycisphaerales bacterium]